MRQGGKFMRITKAGEVECDPAMETMVDYKRGVRNLISGSQLLSLQTGLDADLSAIILKSMKRENVISILGSRNGAEEFRKSTGTKSEGYNGDSNFEGEPNVGFNNG